MRVVVAQEQSGPVRPLLLGMGLECGASDCVPFRALPVRLAQGAADLVLVRVGGEPAAVLELLRQARALTPAPLLVVGPTTDARRVLEVMQAGAREYLDEDRLQEDLEAALGRLRDAGLVRPNRCRVAAVVSATPGAGVSTVATNLAFTWAGQHRDRVALLELGRGPASLALSLDLQPRFTVADVAADWERMDAAFLRQGMTAHPGGVQVLAHHPEELRAAGLAPPAVRKTLILLRTMCDAAVLDLGHVLGDEHHEAMRLCDVVAVVVRLDVPSLRQTRRLLKECAEQGVPADRLRLVANRYGQRGQVPWRQAEEAVGARFAEYLPDDSGRLNHALNHGLPLVLAGRPGGIGRRFARLAKSLNEGVSHDAPGT